jgi:hypothetical protein
MRNPLISLSLLTLSLGAGLAMACSAPDPGVSYPASSSVPGASTGGGGAPTTSEDSGAPPSTGTGTGNNPPTSGTDAGAAQDASTATGEGGAGGDAGDAGGGEGGGALPGFLGETTAYASNLPAVTAFASHTGAGVAQQTPTLDCLSCHVTGGAGVPFLAAGFVATTAGGTTGAADVEVRVYANGGSAAGYSANSDANGYFWINPPLGGTTGPYNAGARNASATQIMPTSQTASDCQNASCHGGSTVGNIHLP